MISQDFGRMWNEAEIIGAADAFEKSFSRKPANI